MTSGDFKIRRAKALTCTFKGFMDRWRRGEERCGWTWWWGVSLLLALFSQGGGFGGGGIPWRGKPRRTQHLRLFHSFAIWDSWPPSRLCHPFLSPPSPPPPAVGSLRFLLFSPFTPPRPPALRPPLSSIPVKDISRRGALRSRDPHTSRLPSTFQRFVFRLSVVFGEEEGGERERERKRERDWKICCLSAT